MKIANDKRMYNEIMNNSKKANFGKYAEALVCKSLGLQYDGRKGQPDGISPEGKKYEVKSFNLTIAKDGKQRYSYANGFGYADSDKTIRQQISEYCETFDYLIVVEGNIEIKNLQVDILKDKDEIWSYLFNRIALCKEEGKDKTRFAYHEINEPFDHQQAKRFNSIIKKGYTL